MAMKRSRKIWFSLIALGAATLLTLLCVEIGFRIVFFQPRGRVAVPHEFKLSGMTGVPYELTPNHDYEWKYGARHVLGGGFSIPVSINSSGYRDDKLIESKPEDEYRILAIGDSFTWGLGVLREDAWVEQLEDLLNDPGLSSDLPEDKRVQVVNTGVGSWNTEVEFEYLRQKGINHEPDAVILGFLINDFRATNTDYLIDDRGFLVTSQKGSRALHLQSVLYDEKAKGSVFKRLIESSHLIRWFSGRRLKTEKRKLMVFNDKASKKRTFDALLGMHQLLRERQIPFYVCIFPYVEDVITESDKNDLAEIGRLCDDHGIPYLHMEEALVGVVPSEHWVHPRDHHPDKFAHELYAKLIFRQFFNGR